MSSLQNRDDQWVQGPLTENLQTNVDHFYQVLCDLRTMIVRIQFQFQTNYYRTRFDVTYEIVSLEAAVEMLRRAEQNFIASTFRIDLEFARVKNVLQGSTAAMNLARETRESLERRRQRLR